MLRLEFEPVHPRYFQWSISKINLNNLGDQGWYQSFAPYLVSL